MEKVDIPNQKDKIKHDVIRKIHISKLINGEYKIKMMI